MEMHGYGRQLAGQEKYKEAMIKTLEEGKPRGASYIVHSQGRRWARTPYTAQAISVQP